MVVGLTLQYKVLYSIESIKVHEIVFTTYLGIFTRNCKSIVLEQTPAPDNVESTMEFSANNKSLLNVPALSYLLYFHNKFDLFCLFCFLNRLHIYVSFFQKNFFYITFTYKISIFYIVWDIYEILILIIYKLIFIHNSSDLVHNKT